MFQQSVAYTLTFLMVQSADHISALTGATVAVTLSKAGGTFAAAGGTITEIANGWYKIALTTTDTNTLGDLAVHATATSGDATDIREQIVAFNPLTANLGLSNVPVNVAQWSGTNVSSPATAGIPDVNVKNFGAVAVTGRDIGASVLLSNGTGAGQLSLTLGTVTVGTNNDKTGYTASTVSDKTGYTVSTVQDKTGYSLTSAEENAIADALLDRANGIETGITPRLALRYIASTAIGVLAGANTTSITLAAAGNAATNRITATVDASGNRTALTLS